MTLIAPLLLVILMLRPKIGLTRNTSNPVHECICSASFRGVTITRAEDRLPRIHLRRVNIHIAFYSWADISRPSKSHP